MLESVVRAADADRARRLADQAPGRRMETIRAAGELRIPFTSGILVGIGETEEERDRLARGARGAARRARPHPGGDPAELRAAPALLRAGAGARSPTRPRASTGSTGMATPRRRARSGAARDGRAASLPLPEWALPGAAIEDMKRLIAETRRLMPDVGIQVPPNLADWWGELVAAGATDLGGPQRQRRPHLPRAPVPLAPPGAQGAPARRLSR